MKTHFVKNPEAIASPALLIFPEIVERNLDQMIALVGGKTDHLRPHVKTHKLPEIVNLQLERGITKTKCATIAEAEMCAIAGSPDVMLAYPMVGPNIQRFLELNRSFPDVTFSALCDSIEIANETATAFESENLNASLFIDLNPGMSRTGILPGQTALELVKFLDSTPGLHFAGVHAYDGHIHSSPLEQRKAAFETAFAPVWNFIEEIEAAGIEMKTLVTGGSPTMGIHAAKSETLPFGYECSAGTPALWDAGYTSKYPELDFECAAVLLTRVISKPMSDTGTLVCLDLGHKAVAAENPIENRVRFPQLPDAEFVQQSEEHLVIRVSDPNEISIGDEFLGIPWHICPSVALHSEAVIIRDGVFQNERWEIAARARRLSI